MCLSWFAMYLFCFFTFYPVSERKDMYLEYHLAHTMTLILTYLARQGG